MWIWQLFTFHLFTCIVVQRVVVSNVSTLDLIPF